MADILIKIPDEIVSFVNINGFIPQKYIKDVSKALLESTPLPKGHGRIGDLDALRCENTDFDTYKDYCTMFDEIDMAPTIIEADKTGSEETDI